MLLENIYQAQGGFTLTATKLLNGKEAPEGTVFRFTLTPEEELIEETPEEPEEEEAPEETDDPTEEEETEEETDDPTKGEEPEEETENPTETEAPQEEEVPENQDEEQEPKLSPARNADFEEYAQEALTVENEGGLITFPTLYYNEADVGKTYVYTVSEVVGDEQLYVFDETVYTVLITVQDHGDGTLDFDTTVSAQEQPDEDDATETELIFRNENLSDLVISKTVDSVWDITRQFLFDVTLTTREGQPLIGDYRFDGSSEGVLSGGSGVVRLRDGDSVTIHDLPMGTRFQVSERPDPAFTVTSAASTNGAEPDMIGRESAEIEFVNTEVLTQISVTKKWIGGEGGAIQLTLGTVQNGEFTPLDRQPAAERIDQTYTFSGLPKYDAQGEQIVYAVREKTVEGYDLKRYINIGKDKDVTQYALDRGTIQNTKTTNFRVRKEWKGLKESEETPEIELVLYKDGQPLDKKPVKTDDGWYVFYTLEAGHTYYVMETPMKGYTTQYENNGERADITDRAYHLGKITNVKAPPTGDNEPLLLWTALGAVSLMGILSVLYRLRKRKQR